MTMKPKVKRFRIRPNQGLPKPEKPLDPVDAAKPAPRRTAQDSDSVFAPADDGFGDVAFPGSAKAEAQSAGQSGGSSTDISEISQEGLTGRQLRNARRLAAKHGLDPKNDFDAVRLLRAKGIDPLERGNLVELVAPEAGAPVPSDDVTPKPVPNQAEQSTKTQKIKLPQTTPPEAPVPAELASPMAQRAREVQDMQRDIARRRRRRMGFLLARLAAFVLLPTIVAGYYFFVMATPLYATKSSLRIDQASAPATGSGLGSLFSGTGLATSQDAVGVQDYLDSIPAMLRLEQEGVGFRSHFMGPEIDPILRLPADATNEDAYKLYKRLVKIGYDPTEGVIRLEVSAPSPELAVQFADRLIFYAEEQADSLTDEIREDQMAGANQSLKDAEENLQVAQSKVLTLQEELGVLDPTSETAAVMTQIATFETQLSEKQLQLQQLNDNAAPNAARVAGVQGDIERLETLIADLRADMTEANGNQRSLARITGELSMAQIDLETRTLMMQEALRQVETARVEANRQVTYLTTIVNPTLPQEASYPRAFEDTLLTFLIMSGIYLVISITLSVLREQA